MVPQFLLCFHTNIMFCLLLQLWMLALIINAKMELLVLQLRDRVISTPVNVHSATLESFVKTVSFIPPSSHLNVLITLRTQRNTLKVTFCV